MTGADMNRKASCRQESSCRTRRLGFGVRVLFARTHTDARARKRAKFQYKQGLGKAHARGRVSKEITQLRHDYSVPTNNNAL